ncbi:integrator complex subunit 2 [Pelomyxa schiedti]|nr:integrator complex subunit 2 [Pelomyxa schiedti]
MCQGDLGRLFEEGSTDDRLTVLVGDLYWLTHSPWDNQYNSDILNSLLYLDEINCALPTVVAYFPKLIPLKELCQGLLRVELGPQLLVNLAANMPHSFYAIIQSLLQNRTKEEPLIKVLEMIGYLSPHCSLFIRSQLLSQNFSSAISVMLALSLNVIHDEIDFLCSLLRNEDSSWFLSLREIPPALRDKIVQSLLNRLQLQSPMNEDIQACGQTHLKSETNTALLLLCCLVSILEFRLAPVDIASVFALSHLESSTRTKQLVVCFLLCCPDISELSTKEEIVSLMTNLTKTNSVTELLLLLGVYIQTSQLAQILELARQTLRISIPLKNPTLHILCSLLRKDVYDDISLAKQAANLPVVQGLSESDNNPNTTIGCVRHLLGNGLFIKYCIDITPWLTKQIIASALPVHSLLPSIITQFVNQLTSNNGAYKMSPIRKEDILQIFGIPNSHEEPNMSARALILLYLLQYNESYMLHRLEVLKTNPRVDIKSPPVYPPDLMYMIPVKQTLNYAQAHPESFGNLISDILPLIADQMPQLLEVSSLMEQLEHTTIKADFHLPCGPIVLDPGKVEAKLDILRNSDSAYEVLCILDEMPLPDLSEYFNVITDKILPHIMDNRFQDEFYHITTKFVALWGKLFTQIPWELSLKTLQHLHSNPTPSASSVTRTHMDYVSDPLSIITREPRAFLCPPLTTVMLKILNLYLTASRKHLTTQAQLSPPNTIQEETTTLILSQDSACIQLLLEHCLEQPATSKASSLSNVGVLEETRTIVCSFLHQMFCQNPILIKLVHFQGYHTSLIPITTEGIPSMHKCLDFLDELLCHPQMIKQVFAIQLTGCLVKKYPIPRSHEMAELVLNKYLQKYIDAPLPGGDPFSALSHGAVSPAAFLTSTLPSLVPICTTFPDLAPSAIKLLLELHAAVSDSTGQHPSSEQISPLDHTITTTFRLLQQTVLSLSL